VVGLALAALVVDGARAAPLQQRPPPDFRETISTQDPGYLKLPVRILDRSTMEIFTFRPDRGETAAVSFRLTRPAEIRLRIVRRDPPRFLVRTLRDWTRFALGPNVVEWDGRDASGGLLEDRGLQVVFDSLAGPHSKHAREQCHELEIQVAQVAVSRRSDPQSSRWTATLIGDGAYGPSSGYRLLALLDWRPWVDETHPSAATVFELPPPPELAPGRHLLAVNLADGEDHVGAATLSFVVE
jgi:hypothetical protein